jgi:hypothetical protein
MGGMNGPFFQDLQAALKTAPDLGQIQHVWQEGQALLAAVRSLLPPTLQPLVLRARRADPVRGIRGSELAVIARNAAAAAKLRLALADQISALQAKGWGLQSIKVTAQRVQSIDTVIAPCAPRDPIPAGAKQRFTELAQTMRSEALQRALRRIGGR